MKLDETTIDDEKENSCNGNGIHEKPIVKPLPTPEPSNGELHDNSGSSDPPGVGDLLVEDTSVARQETEEHQYQNGNRADDSTSVSSSSSNFPIAEQDDLSEEEEITLRLSDDEDLAATASNETDNKYYTSSPCPKADDDKNKKEEDKTTSATEDNSKTEKDSEPLNNMKEEIGNNDNNHSESEIISEKTDNKDSSVEKIDDKDNPVEKSNDKGSSVEKSDDEDSSIEKSDNKEDSVEKSDDNLENLISDLNEQSKSALKSESEKVTISDLRKEIEDFIKNHDNDEKSDTDSNCDKTENTTESVPESSETETAENELNIKISDAKSEAMETDNENEISEENDMDHETIKIENNDNEISENIDTDIDIKTHEIIKEENIDLDSSEIKVEPSTTELENENTEISEIKETNTENISENVSESTSANVSESISENVSEIIPENITENIVEKESQSISENNVEKESTIISENDSESSSENSSEIISETIKENNDEIMAVESNIDSTEPEPEIDENKQPETPTSDETKADTPSELPESPKTTESDESCQETNDEIIEPETTAENQETETNNTETPDNDKPEITCDENNTEEKQNTENISDKEEKSDNECIELMDVDSNEKESETTIDNNKKDKDTILIDDDVEMKEDYDKDKTKDKTNDQEEKAVEKNDAFDLLKEDAKDPFDKLKEDEKDAFDKLKDAEQTKSDKKPEESTKTDDIKGENHDRPGEPKTSLKRSLENDEDTQDVKKPKINGIKKQDSDKKKYFSLDVFREFMAKKSVSTLTRAELEQFCLQKMCEAITQTSKIGDLNRKITQQETMIETLRTKYSNLTKQVRDLEVVHSRVLQEVRTKCKEANVEITPVKITRSVGLQVTLQAIANRGRTIAPQPQQEQPAVAAPTGGVKRKLPQRSSLPNKLPPSSPPSSMPPPIKPPVRSPNQGKGIKTILPKVYPAADPKDQNPSLLENYLQQTPGTSKTIPSVRKSAPGGGSSIAPVTPTPSTSAPKVIDLTDEDDTQKAPATPATTAIRVVASQQLTTTTAVATGSLPRLTYLVQGSQQGQQLLLATSTPTTRPGQVRSTLMFKPVAPGQVQTGQRLNIVRQNVPGIAVLPTTSTSAVRPGQQIRFTAPTQNTRPQVRAVTPARHPAPLPGPPAVQPSQPNWKAMPPKPSLKISRVGDGIVLSWRMQNNKDMSLYEDIGSYQLYAYQETSGPPSTDMWRKVGDVKALALPMACTLTQFTDGNKYHFAVRAVDVKSRVGPFSQPEQIALP